MWIDDELKVFNLMLMAIMAGLLLHAVAGTPASCSCFSHLAAVPLLPPSTPRNPSLPSLVALPLSRSCTSLSASRVSTLLRRVLLHVPGGYFVETVAKNLLATVGVFY